MKRVVSLMMTALLLFLCAFAVHADAQESDEDVCPCTCHVFYSERDTLIERIADKTIDCKTLFQVMSYCVKLFTWRVLGIRQYCACGIRHY